MSSNQKDLKAVKTDTKLAAQMNKCGICRANGIPPPCRGHGGGSGGGSSSGGDESRDAKKESLAPGVKPTNEAILEKLLGNPRTSSFWLNPLSMNHVYEYKNDNAFHSIKIDFDEGVLVVKGKDGLTKEQSKQLREYIDNIRLEFSEFQNELKKLGVNVDGFKMMFDEKTNTLTISIPNKEHFTAFMNRLVNKNLLATKALLDVSRELSSTANNDVKCRTPTPFDGKDTGPRPDDK